MRGAQPIQERTGLVLLLKINTGMKKGKSVSTMAAVSGTHEMTGGSLRKTGRWVQDSSLPVGR